MGQTFGEKRVRADFNASRSDKVANLKNGFARLMDIVESINSPYDNPAQPDDYAEASRLKAIALTHLETAAMYAVKAATTKTA